MIFGSVFVGLFVLIGPFSPLSVPTGLGQRAGFLVWYSWFVLVAVEMSKRAQKQRPAAS